MTTPVTAARAGSRAPMLLALFFGLLAGLLTFAYISQIDEGETGEAVPALESANVAPVVMASQAIPVGTTITEDMLREAQVPDTLLVQGALTSIPDVVGKVARFPVQPGEQVLASDLSELGTEVSLSFSVPPGHRAMSVQVDEVVAVGGFVRPGDFVDVVVTYEVNGVDISFIAAQDVEVLAVAQIRRAVPPPTGEESTEGPAAQAEAQLPEGEPDIEALSVTLALTPEEAVRVFLGDSNRDKKHLRLLLRPFGEHNAEEIEPFFFRVSAAALTEAGALPEAQEESQ